MSVLYKALQKAEKENEQRQADSAGESFDPERLAGSGAISSPSGGALNWRVAGPVSAIVLAVVIGAAFFLFQPASDPQVASVPPQPSAPVMQPPAPTTATADGIAADAEMETVAVEDSAVEDSAAANIDESVEEEIQADPVEVAQVESLPSASPPSRMAVETSDASEKEPMPELAADSPTRMLSPPVSINRGDFALAGVGDAVQVRNVSRQAQDNAGAGYSALIRGEYDTALAFYDQALQQEPRSALALLGRGAALQKLGRSSEAQGAYDAVLRLDPKNREALTNLTAIVSERAPNEALAQLLDLERQHPNFSPITAQIGLTHAKMGSMPEARDYLRRAVALTPAAVMYHYNLALVLDHMALSDQAVRSYENVLAAMAGGRANVGLSPVDIERRVRYLRTR